MLSVGTDPLSTRSVAENAPRVLVACEDQILVEAMLKIIGWARPRWLVVAAVGVDAVRRELARRPFDVVVCGVEPRARCGAEMLHHARIQHPQTLRVAYRTSDACQGPELGQAHEQVPWPADAPALVAALDRAVSRAAHRSLRDGETPSVADVPCA